MRQTDIQKLIRAVEVIGVEWLEARERRRVDRVLRNCRWGDRGGCHQCWRRESSLRNVGISCHFGLVSVAFGFVGALALVPCLRPLLFGLSDELDFLEAVDGVWTVIGSDTSSPSALC